MGALRLCGDGVWGCCCGVRALSRRAVFVLRGVLVDGSRCGGSGGGCEFHARLNFEPHAKHAPVCSPTGSTAGSTAGSMSIALHPLAAILCRLVGRRGTCWSRRPSL
jgi:hypothetical protein